MSLTVDELRELSKQIIENNEIINDLPFEKLVELRKYIHPLGNIVGDNKSYAALSLINWSEKYLRNLLVTSLVGYLFKIADEYEPHTELEKERNDYLREDENYRNQGASDEKINQLKQNYESRVKLINKIARNTIKTFLTTHFQYDPNRHVRAATSKVDDDPDRKAKWPSHDDIRTHAKNINKSLSQTNQTYEYAKQHILNTHSKLSTIITSIKSARARLTVDDDNIAIIDKNLGILKNIYDDLSIIAAPLSQDNCAAAMTIDVPADVYHHFNRYIDNNFEKLLEITDNLYNTKRDVEFSVILHSISNSLEDVKKYIAQHKSEFRTDVHIIESGCVTILGPYNENRNKIDVYDKNTTILKRIMDQAESDHKLAKDLMEKRVKNQKRRNIEEAGPDHPGLNEYIRCMNIANELAGTERALSKEERDKLEEAVTKAKKIKEDYEVPEGAIQVDMYHPEPDDDGSFRLKKTHFYTQEEEPLHLAKDSEYANKYQPIKK